MQIFLSYGSEHRDIAEPIAFALRERGHEVFLDRDYLLPGRGFNRQIEQDIKDSDLMVFLITPQTVTPGRYTMTELEFARQSWRRPYKRVLPVMVEETDMSRIPSFLKAVSILHPKGNLVAETAAAVDRLRGLEYAMLVALQMAAISLVCGLLSYFSYEGDSGRAWLRFEVEGVGILPAPQNGLLFGFPIAFGAWWWGIRRWWVFLVPMVIIAACYLITAPTISKYTHQLTQADGVLPEFREVKSVIENVEKVLTNAAEKELLRKVESDFIDFKLKYYRSLAGLLIGSVLAIGTMLSLGLVLPAFRSVFRWLLVIAVGGVVSSIVTYFVLAGGTDFSRWKAVMLMTLWLVVFGSLVGYWLARGRTSVSG
jgi:hypothetical protein